MQYVTHQELIDVVEQLIPYWIISGIFGAILFDLFKDFIKTIAVMFGRIAQVHPKIAAIVAYRKRRSQERLEAFLIAHPYLLTKRQAMLDEELQRLQRLKALVNDPARH